MNWKLPAGFSIAGALVYLILGIARGNPIGVVLLRLLIPAVACGGVGFAVQFLLRRYLPELLTQAGNREAPTVDIVIDDPMELGAAEPSAGPRPGGPEPADAGVEGLEPGGLGPEGLGVEAPELLPEFGGVELGIAGGPGVHPPAEAVPESAEAVPEAVEALPEADELAAPEGAEGLGELERLPTLESFAPSTTTRRGLQVEKVEAQVDSLVKGQDPASLAKAVRSFMKKD